MKKLDTLISFVFTKAFYHKAIAYWILISFLIFFQDFALVFFITFVFAYLFYSSSNFIKTKVDSFVCKKLKKAKDKKKFKKVFSLNLIIIIQYLVFIFVLYSIISDAIPKILTELNWLSETVPILWDKLGNVKDTLSQINKDYTEIWITVKEAFTSSDYNILINFFGKLKDAWIVLFKLVFSLVLSFVFLLDRNKLKKYLKWIKRSNFSFLYKEYKIIFDKITRSFGLILKAQALVSFTNAVLIIIWLLIIWTVFTWSIWFPYLITLWLLVFILWFIPIIWVILSSVPIVLVGFYTVWWIPIVVSIILLIVFVNIIESYYLNPKVVSSFLDLPVTLTFVVLFIWEHLFWIAWLLVWVSLFYFLMELFRDIDKAITKKHKVKKIEKKIIKRVKKIES